MPPKSDAGRKRAARGGKKRAAGRKRRRSTGLLGATLYDSAEDSDYRPTRRDKASDSDSDELPVQPRSKRTNKAEALLDVPISTRLAQVIGRQGHKTAGPREPVVKAGYAASSIPSDVLRQVLLYACKDNALPTAAAVNMVCKAWRQVALDLPQLWAHLDLVKWVRRGDSEEPVAYKLTDGIAKQVAVEAGRWQQVQSVRFLDRSGRLTDAALLHLAHGCPLLRELDLSGCTELRQDGVIAAIQAMTSLTSLNLSHCVILPRGTGLDRVIRAAVTPRAGRVSCGLVTLKAVGCHTLSRASMQALMAPPKGSETQGTPHLLELQYLDLTDSGSTEGRLQLNPERLQACAPHLRVLKVTGLGGVFGWDISFMRGAEPVKQPVEPQQPAGNAEASNSAAAAAVDMAPAGPGGASEEKLRSAWQELQVLEVGTGEQRSVTLGTRKSFSCLTNTLLLRLAQHAQHLHTLDVSGCQQHTLTPAVLGQLACKNSLKTLVLRRSSLGCDEGLEQAALHFGPSLEAVDVSGCPGAVTDVGVEVLALSAPNLHTLDLSGSAITEKGLRVLLEHCPRLTSLDVTSCRSLSRSVRMAEHQEGGTRTGVSALKLALGLQAS